MFDQYNGRGAVRQSGGSFAEQHAARRGPQSSAAPAPAAFIPSPDQTPAAPASAVVSLRTTEPEPKPSDSAIAFLKTFDPAGRHNLVAIDPEKKARLEGRTFGPGAWDEIAPWIDAREGRLNIYFSVNEPAADAPHDKLDKGAISAIRAVHVDVDPADEQNPDMAVRRAHSAAERLRLRALIDALGAGPLPPSVTVDSGNGVYPIWLLSKKLDAAEWRAEIEAQNLGIAEALGGDRPARDISRILRLPGTMNIPDAGKLAKGRTPRRASMISSCNAKYDLDQIGARYAPVFSVDRTDKSPEIDRLIKAIDLSTVTQAGAYDELPAELRWKFEDARAADSKLSGLWASGVPAGLDKSASAARFELAERLKADAFSPDEFGSLLWVWEHATSDGKPRMDEWEDYDIRRDIARCWSKAPARPNPLDWFDEIPDDVAVAAPTPAKDVRRLDLVPFADAVTSALEQSAKPLIKGLLDQGALSVLYGESNVGKTFVAMDIAFHVATGTDWADRRTAHMGVVYVAAEGGRGARRRAMALAKRYGNPVAERARFQFRLAAVNLLQPNADLAPLVETVRSCGGVGLIVIDTLSRALAGGDENASTDMGAFVKHVDRLRQATGAHVMLVHHSGKVRARGARGHSLLRAATDTEIEIADNEISVTKQRDLDGDFRQAFMLDRVELGKDADGDPITSCTVRLTSHSEKPVGEPTAAEEEVLIVLRALQEDNMSAKGFKPEEIANECAGDGTPILVETVRTRLRSMKDKRLVEQPRRGVWRAKTDKKSGGNASTDLLQALDADD
ncbi:AAA family ATPase [Rhizobium leguminosarum]|uniref:helicase RepA family protein n=1 Tax=Rhizobium leguminosarum TaxID=384 RepID=UPI001C9229DE|nr:helicase RepA family protein [Rhizobium leguminosarum]MBY2913978.1 AAA family ATPase [Rhizobium leguminosarum]